MDESDIQDDIIKYPMIGALQIEQQKLLKENEIVNQITISVLSSKG